MPITATCPNCGVRLRAPDGAEGRALMCPKCGNKVPVPLASPDEAPSELQLVVNSYIQHNLMPCEHLVGITCIHPLVLVAPGIVAALGLLLGLVGILVGESGILLVVIGLPMAVLAGLIMIAQLVERLTTEFSCTDRRIVIKSGLITTQLREMPLAKVEALLMEQGLFGKLFGYGTLVFKGTGGTRRTCKNIEAPFDFYKRVQQQVAVAQQHMPGGAGPRRTDG